MANETPPSADLPVKKRYDSAENTLVARVRDRNRPTDTPVAHPFYADRGKTPSPPIFLGKSSSVGMRRTQSSMAILETTDPGRKQ